MRYLFFIPILAVLLTGCAVTDSLKHMGKYQVYPIGVEALFEDDDHLYLKYTARKSSSKEIILCFASVPKKELWNAVSAPHPSSVLPTEVIYDGEAYEIDQVRREINYQILDEGAFNELAVREVAIHSVDFVDQQDQRFGEPGVRTFAFYAEKNQAGLSTSSHPINKRTGPTVILVNAETNEVLYIDSFKPPRPYAAVNESVSGLRIIFLPAAIGADIVTAPIQPILFMHALSELDTGY